MIEAGMIAEVLGGSEVIGRPVSSIRELDEFVADGLPKIALRKCVQHVYRTRKDQNQLLYGIVPQATYKRRRKLLSPRESERTERLARVIATAEYVWDDEAAVRQFLTSSHPAFDNRSPIDAAKTELGARRVEELLWRIFHGLPA